MPAGCRWGPGIAVWRRRYGPSFLRLSRANSLPAGALAGARGVMGAGSSLPADKTRRDRRWLGFGLHELFQLSEDAHSTTALTDTGSAQRVEDIFAGAYGGSGYANQRSRSGEMAMFGVGGDVDAGGAHGGGADASMDGPIGELAPPCCHPRIDGIVWVVESLRLLEEC